jgi:hypothetical protein
MEMKIIRRLLDSTKGVIDAVSILTNGESEDGPDEGDTTGDVVREWMKENNVPGEVWYRKWTDFGPMRRLSYTLAQETGKKLDYFPDKTYSLFLDADMILVKLDSYSPYKLKDLGYTLGQEGTDEVYPNLRLARHDKNWKCFKRTHEYWGIEEFKMGPDGNLEKVNYTHELLEDLLIRDIGDGGVKADKFIRDIKATTKDLEDEPGDVRSQFYLGNSFKDAGYLDQAIVWLTKRTTTGWIEEQYWSRYQLGLIYKNLFDMYKWMANLKEDEYENEENRIYKNSFGTFRPADRIPFNAFPIIKPATPSTPAIYGKNPNPDWILVDLKGIDPVSPSPYMESDMPLTTYMKEDGSIISPSDEPASSDSVINVIKKGVTKYLTETIKWFRDAYEFRLSRTEALMRLSELYKDLKDDHKSHTLAVLASRTEKSTDTLFIQISDMTWKPWWQIGSTAYYMMGSDKAIKLNALKAMSNLRLCKKAPDWANGGAGQMMQFYMNPLFDFNNAALDFDRNGILPLDTETEFNRLYRKHWSVCNTSMVYDKRRRMIVANIRSVNFIQTDGCNVYQSMDLDHKIRTTNYLALIDPDTCKIVRQWKVIDQPLDNSTDVLGNEDCRIFMYQKRYWFIGNTRGWGWKTPQMCIGRYEDVLSNTDLGSVTCQVDSFKRIGVPDYKGTEKNWLPFIDSSGNLKFLYESSPITIITPNLETGECVKTIVIQEPNTFTFKNFRGGAPLVQFDDGWLYIIHEVGFDDGDRRYYHRIVQLDKRYNPIRVSLPFQFFHNGVEYCMAIVPISTTTYLLSIGVEDSCVYTIKYQRDDIMALLKDGHSFM